MNEFVLNGIVYKQTQFQGYFVTQDGDIAKIKFNNLGNLKSYFLMEQEIVKSGHCRVEINHKHYFVHRLVYETWGEEKLNNHLVIDHIDANPKNNNIKNLRQVTQKINIQNAINHGNFGHNGNTKIEVFNNDTGETKIYNCVKDFMVDIQAPEYMLRHGGLSCLRKRKEYDKYTWKKIDKH